MSPSSVCRVCLEGNVKLTAIASIPLLNIYERITNTQFNSNEGPSAVCPFCYQKLLKCYTFFTMAWKAENVFDQLVLQGVKEFVTKLELGVTQHMKVAPMQSVTIDSSTAYKILKETIKEEPKTIDSSIAYEPLKVAIKKEPKTIDSSTAYEPLKVAIKEEPKPVDKEENGIIVKSTAVCRICLAGNLMLNPMESKQLLDIYQKLTNIKFNSEDGRPRAVCPFCYQKLLKCYIFSKIACRSEKLFDQLLLCGYKEITKELVSKLTLGVKQTLAVSHMQSITIDLNSTTLPLMVTVKGEPIPVQENEAGNSGDLILEECIKRRFIKPPAKFLCTECGKQYNTEVSLKRHMSFVHRDKKEKYVCKICNKEVKFKHSLARHMKCHSDNKEFACTVCNKKFRNMHHLLPHMRTHTGEKPFPCTVCLKRFNEKSHLNRHMVVHTGREHTERRFSCNECNKTFHIKPNLIRHMLVHSGERPFPCSICDKRFKIKYDLDVHIKHIHDKVLPQFACHLCGKRYHYRSPFRVHLRTHNSNRESKTFQCTVCNERCTRKKHLITHMRLLHPGQRLYACNDCDKQYDKRSHLIRHMSTHQGQQYTCDLCDRKFVHKYNLEGHMKSHTGGRPFSLTLCKKKYYLKYMLNKHIKKKHTGKSESKKHKVKSESE